jgi:hypothetical protein
MTYSIELTMKDGRIERFYSESTNAAVAFYRNLGKKKKHQRDHKIFLEDYENHTCKIIDLGHVASIFIKGVKYKEHWNPMQIYPEPKELDKEIYHHVDVHYNNLEVVQKKITEK